MVLEHINKESVIVWVATLCVVMWSEHQHHPSALTPMPCLDAETHIMAGVHMPDQVSQPLHCVGNPMMPRTATADSVQSHAPYSADLHAELACQALCIVTPLQVKDSDC